MIYLVIPCYNRKQFTEDCLLSLTKQTYQNFKVIVVDDGSTDGTSEMIAEKFPETIVLRGDGNLWWTGSVNFGIEHALKEGATHVVTLNDDTIVPPNFMSQMLKANSQKPLAVIGALEKDIKTGETTFGGLSVVSEILDKWVALHYTLPPEEQVGLHHSDVLPGRGLWIPKEVFDKIGLFDIKNFPHYFADFDFTCNAKKAGFEVFINYDAPLFTYPDESGESKIMANKTMKGYREHLFGIRGGGNLVLFTRYTLKNNAPHEIPIKLVLGYTRRLFNFWMK